MARGLKKKQDKDGRGRGQAAGGNVKRRPKRSSVMFKRKRCSVCAKKIVIDYKDVELLKSLTTERGKMLTRRLMGICWLHQRQITRAVKRARHLALIPFEQR